MRLLENRSNRLDQYLNPLLEDRMPIYIIDKLGSKSILLYELIYYLKHHTGIYMFPILLFIYFLLRAYEHVCDLCLSDRSDGGTEVV